MKLSMLPLAAVLALASAQAATPDATAVNPFAEPSPLPYHYPPFDRIGDATFRAAYEAGMAEQLREIASIADNPEPPTFENTIVAMERSGALLSRVGNVFNALTSSNTNDELEKIDAEMAPRLSAHGDAIALDPKLFARVKSLYERRASLGLDSESLRLLERYHTQFVRAGAPLPEAEKAKLRAMNEQLSSLTTQFQQSLLKASTEGAVVVDDVAHLDGLPEDEIAAAAEAAKSRNLPGKWVLTLQNTTGQPPEARLKNRALRERLHKASAARGQGGANDTLALVAQIVKLRAERARLLGYPHHAAYVLEDETARTAQAVNDMLGKLAPAALANARKEAAAMQKVIDAEARASKTRPFKLEAWDWAYYAEKVRQAQYAFDESQVRPYFELERVLRDGVFFAAGQLFGITFRERKDLPVYHPDVRVFEVFEDGGAPLGLFTFDPFRRDSKRGGAWMNEFVSQSRLFGYKPVVGNNLNIVKPPAGQPVLLGFDDVNTLFHEFGHAVHGLFSSVNYPLFAGTSVPRDYVEFPSQYNEMWATEPRVLANYAKHHQTGEPMPQALMDKIIAAGKFNEGFATTEYLAAAILDQSWHQITPEQAPAAPGVMAFEAAALKKAGLDWAPVPPRYRTPYFAHVFSGGYSAGYYAYIWSDVLARNTQHWFNTHGGLQRANGEFLRAKILSKGFSMDALTAFREFYGKDPEIGPLLEHRGLTLTAQ